MTKRKTKTNNTVNYIVAGGCCNAEGVIPVDKSIHTSGIAAGVALRRRNIAVIKGIHMRETMCG